MEFFRKCVLEQEHYEANIISKCISSSIEDDTGWRVYNSSVPRPFIESFINNKGAFEPGIVISYCDILYNCTKVFL
jgi:hypothetical protein